jgi:hypothetical protein
MMFARLAAVGVASQFSTEAVSLFVAIATNLFTRASAKLTITVQSPAARGPSASTIRRRFAATIVHCRSFR